MIDHRREVISGTKTMIDHRREVISGMKTMIDHRREALMSATDIGDGVQPEWSGTTGPAIISSS